MNSIKKGKRGEREVAKLLTSITQTVWKRVPCSGALFTSQGSEQFKGDVYCDTVPYDKITVEVKNQKVVITANDVISINDALNRTSTLHKWIKQLKTECGVERIGVLFFKNKGKWVWYLHRPGGFVLESRFMSRLRENSECYHDFGIINKEVKMGIFDEDEDEDEEAEEEEPKEDFI